MNDPPATDTDLHLFHQGRHPRIHRFLGAQPCGDGAWFGVWAPSARSVQVCDHEWMIDRRHRDPSRRQPASSIQVNLAGSVSPHGDEDALILAVPPLADTVLAPERW
ncbi:MAG: hypothetical protein OEY70_02355 [Acidimicrobiia bacterium]|nr:hypothetical protein [Acidimicrobiia bacterium]